MARRSLVGRVWFYNLGTPTERDAGYQSAVRQVSRELAAIASTGAALIAVAEAIGYRLPRLDGHVLVRDTSTPGRANVALYVRRDLLLRRIKWHDQRETWGRTQHPGQHPARSILSCRVNHALVIVDHQPPKGTDNVLASQQESLNTVARIARRPWNRLLACLVLTDANRTPSEPSSVPGPRQLAKRIAGQVHGDRIDCLVTRGLDVDHLAYVHRVAGVLLKSDHRHALRGHIREEV